MLKALWAMAIGTGLVLATGAPGFAQMRTSQPQRPSGAVTAYSTPKPSGSIGLFGWYPFLSAGALSTSTLAPGIAGNLWFTPNLSFGIWASPGPSPPSAPSQPPTSKPRSSSSRAAPESSAGPSPAPAAPSTSATPPAPAWASRSA